MPWPGESRYEKKLGEDTLCVLALFKREDGSCSIVGMRGITGGEFVSSKRLYAEYRKDDPLLPTVDEEEVSALAAQGGELFVINHVDLRESAEELHVILGQVAREDKKDKKPS